MQNPVPPSFFVTKTTGDDHGLSLGSIWPPVNISVTHSSSFFIFWGDMRHGAQRMGGRSPVLMSCSTVSVCLVRGAPDTGNISEYSDKTVARRRLCVGSRSRHVCSTKSWRWCGSASVVLCDCRGGSATHCIAVTCVIIPTSVNGVTTIVSWLKFDTRTGIFHFDGSTRLYPR